LSRRFGIPLNYNLCSRIRATPHQLSLKKKDRVRNVRGGFRVSGQLDTPHVALIDDVVTTGATASELTRLLKKNGAERVDVWAVARTP
jgi:predicted amidophosphoribosyltransferase